MAGQGHSGASAAFHVLTKPVGAVCNLDCEYCFYLAKEMRYPGGRFRMAAETHERYLRQLLAAHARAPEVMVSWQGGEPTMMGLEFFRRSVELQRRLARPGQRVLTTLQTNGTLLDDEWGEFLAANHVLVGISIDGPRRLHDAYRVDKGGKPTYDRVLRGLEVLRRHGVDWNVLCTVNAANGDHGLEVYRFLRDDLGSQFIQFIPVVEQGRPWSVGPEQYGEFLIDVFDEWVRRDVGSVFVQLFDTTLANWAGEPGSMCVHAEVCGRGLVLEHNGDVFSCDHFVDSAHLLGNIAERSLLEMACSSAQLTFGAAKRTTLPAYCHRCEVRFACHGGCPKDRFAVSPGGEAGLNYLCPGYLAFFRHVSEPMRIMQDLLRRGRSPAEVMTR